MVEPEIIRRAQSGDREALVFLLKQLETRVYRTAYYLMKNEQDALDATQEALLKIYKHLPSFKGDSMLHTWAQRIVTNVCMDQFRKRKKVVLMHEETWQEDKKAVREVERGVIASDLKQAINRLPDPQRTAIILRYVQEYNYQEIAEAMQLPLNTVKSHLFRARKQLQEWLSEYQEGGATQWKVRK
ncbi:RNA polymerase sigma factor [Paenactinomyces guangxiensis]|uniref:RNA polymerase sigma factor n=1 Tax=Paenactinomyces guangxiensis TaxID=1490290 RepID=A0A7W1WND4_9BACL|nr:RNA polymerase sigma factor [Paenactinomyces guangxiensis]MBA4493103.1 RNA polymerase sigma factor [Paenactinomyces guangxiensis]MBH8590047.1 RNA polymerase sigma factor [Paenactinomyces guangxiensis]